MIQTTFLWYLLKISQYKSFSAAAEALHISQPALSSAIKTLEEQLGTKLLNRTNKGVSLTEDGKKVIEKAKQVFSLLDDIEFMFQKPEKPTFLLDDIIIYTNPAFTGDIITALSKDFSHSKAKNALQIFMLQPDSDINKLIATSSNTVIIAILPENYHLETHAKCVVLNTGQASISISQDFPYFSPNQTSVSIKELTKVPLAVTKQSYAFQTTLLKMIAQYGQPNVQVIAPDQSSAYAAVKSGIAAGFGSSLFAHQKEDSIKYLPIRNAPKFNLMLIYGDTADPAIVETLTRLLAPLQF